MPLISRFPARLRVLHPFERQATLSESPVKRETTPVAGHTVVVMSFSIELGTLSVFVRFDHPAAPKRAVPVA
jgi:hypothetical protein